MARTCCHDRPRRWNPRHGSLLALAGLLLLIPGCAAPDEATRQEAPVVEEPAATGPAREIEWLFPAEGRVWEHGTLMPVLALPLDTDPDAVGVTVNGVARTALFRPLGTFNPERWRPGTDAGDDPDGSGDPDEAPPVRTGRQDGGGRLPRRASHRRAVAVLDESHLRSGENILAAEAVTADGTTVRAERRFLWMPRGRRLAFQVLEERADGTRHPTAARVTLIPAGEDGTSLDCAPIDTSTMAALAGSPERAFVLTRANGRGAARVPAGRWRAVASRGVLDGIDVWEVPAAGDGEHTFVLQREVTLGGIVAVDFHVHAAASVDSLVPLRERVWSLVAGGLDAFVASDHGDITDYRPLIRELGQADRLLAIPGVEAAYRRTGATSLGHWNVWPLEPRRGAHPEEPAGHGALRVPEGENTAVILAEGGVPEMFDAYRERARRLAREAGRPPRVDPAIIELNHPRGILGREGKEIGPHAFFNNVAFDPARPLSGSQAEALLRPSSAGTTAMDFDVLEIWNRSSRPLYRQVRNDWFALMNQGWIYTGAANTDTHSVSPDIPGYPVNLVFLPDGAAAGPGVPVGALAAAVRAGRLVGTDGPVPLLTAAAGGRAAGPGDTLTVREGRLRARVEVRAASWVPVGEVRLWLNGRVVASGPPPVLEAELAVDGDAWLLAEVGDAESDADVTDLYRALLPRALALGFTNPVRIDADGDGFRMRSP